MHTFLDNFLHSGKYSAQLASHQAELRREEMYPNRKCLNISALQTEYLNLDSSQSSQGKCGGRSLLKPLHQHPSQVLPAAQVKGRGD